MKMEMRLSIIFMLIIGYNYCLAQQYEKLIVPFEHNGEFGYMNGANEVIIEPQYDSTFLCKGGLCRFKSDGKYGFFNMAGEEVIKPKYDEASDFVNCVSEVKIGNRKKVIDENGKKAKLRCYSAGCGRSITIGEIDSSRVFIQNNGKIGLLCHPKIINTVTSQLKVDSIYTNFDSLVAITKTTLGAVKMGKIGFFPLNITGHGGALMIHDSLFKYDEVKFIEKESIKIAVLMRIEKEWGILGHGPFMNELTEAKYKDILTRDGNYYLVEYEENKFGYVDSNSNEYWIK